MATGHMNAKRILHRITEEIIATKRIADITSWGGALATFRAKIDIQIMNHNGYYESLSTKKHLHKKHDVMMDYFNRTFSDVVKSYNHTVINNQSDMSDCIWICWWQGLDQAPDIVKKCVDSIKVNAGSHRVIIITEDNYKDYVQFPDWLEKKKEKGIISRTHYSDLLRLELLAEHGGIWLDSTFFCVSNEIEKYFEMPVWSIKRPDYGHSSVACGYFANYSFGCTFENRDVFMRIRDYAFQYWQMNDFMIDYLFLDYLVVLAQKNNSNIDKAFKTIPSNNPNCDELFKVLGKPFDEKKWDELKKDTALFKLTWKKEFPLNKDGKMTFYGMLLEGKL